jgi:hypothetical protein
MVGALARRCQVAYAKRRGLSVRRACALMSVARSTLGYESRLVKRDAPTIAVSTTLAWDRRDVTTPCGVHSECEWRVPSQISGDILPGLCPKIGIPQKQRLKSKMTPLQITESLA